MEKAKDKDVFIRGIAECLSIGNSVRYDWQLDVVIELRNILDLPYEMDAPIKRTQFEWMEDFANQQSLGGRFVNDVAHALDSRHPFRHFEETMYRWSIEKKWFAFKRHCYEDYVRNELPTF